MRLLHFLEIENFKRFGDRQRIELDHPGVLIGPNNCGKTSAIQAPALWSQAVKTWYEVRKQSSAKERTATALNRLSIVAAPVQRTRFFWHNAAVRTGNKDVPLVLTVGEQHEGRVRPLAMRFRNQGDELVYCAPDDAVIGDLGLIHKAASLDIELLYPMSGIETEEPILQPGRIDVLLGQGQTAQVLRNLCLMVAKAGSAPRRGARSPAGALRSRRWCAARARSPTPGSSPASAGRGAHARRHSGRSASAPWRVPPARSPDAGDAPGNAARLLASAWPHSWLAPWPRHCHRTKTAEVDLGVNEEGVQIAMAQHIGHLLERATGVEQTAGPRVAQDVHTGVWQTGTAIRLTYGAPHDVCGHRFVHRRDVPNEDPAAGGARKLRAEVVGNGCAGGLRQRQHIDPPRLALVDANGAAHPVDVVKFQGNDLCTAQTQIDNAAHEGVATQSRREIYREGAQQPLDLLRHQGLGQRCQPPMCRPRDDRQQVFDAITLEGTELQVATHGGGGDAGTGGAHPRDLLGQEPPKLLG